MKTQVNKIKEESFQEFAEKFIEEHKELGLYYKNDYDRVYTYKKPRNFIDIIFQIPHDVFSVTWDDKIKMYDNDYLAIAEDIALRYETRYPDVEITVSHTEVIKPKQVPENPFKHMDSYRRG